MKTLTSILVLAVVGVLFFAAGKGIYDNIHLDPKKQDRIMGKVTWAKVVAKRSSGRGAAYYNIFEFQLDTVEEPLGVFQTGQNYSPLIQNIRIGDTVTVYFHRHSNTNLNRDVYQIEKNGQIVLAYKTYYNKQTFLIMGILILAICFLGFNLWYGWHKMLKRLPGNDR